MRLTVSRERKFLCRPAPVASNWAYAICPYRSRRSPNVLTRFFSLTAWSLLLIAWCSSARADEPKPAKNLLANPSFELGRQFWDLGKGGKTVASWDINGD